MANAHGLSDEAVKTIIRKTAEWAADELPAEEVDQDEFIEQQARKLAVQIERDFNRMEFYWLVKNLVNIGRMERGMDLGFLYGISNDLITRSLMIESLEVENDDRIRNIFNSLTVGV